MSLCGSSPHELPMIQATEEQGDGAKCKTIQDWMEEMPSLRYENKRFKVAFLGGFIGLVF